MEELKIVEIVENEETVMVPEIIEISIAEANSETIEDLNGRYNLYARQIVKDCLKAKAKLLRSKKNDPEDVYQGHIKKWSNKIALLEKQATFFYWLSDTIWEETEFTLDQEEIDWVKRGIDCSLKSLVMRNQPIDSKQMLSDVIGDLSKLHLAA